MFGKPKGTPPPPVIDVQEETYYIIEANLRTGWKWAWECTGENSYAEAKEFLATLTGEPDEHGYIRANEDSWAYRPEEILGVTIQKKTRKVEVSSE